MFERQLVSALSSRLTEPRRFMQIVMGPRQTGKTTAIGQALKQTDLPHRFSSGDQALLAGRTWLQEEWSAARRLITKDSPSAIFVLDEIQAVPQWSSIVKMLWDEDARSGIDLRVVLTGSSALLLQSGLSESLMGRFEILHSTHWSYAECREAFDYSFHDFLLYGGYPGGAPLRHEPDRWKSYIESSIIESTLSKDVLALESIRKPALLRQLFSLGCAYSGQEVSYRKLLGQLDDAGNTTTIAHYLELLSRAGMLTGLQKYSGNTLRMKGSSPRLAVYDTALMVVASAESPETLLEDSAKFGRLAESAVGAYLLSRSKADNFDLYWWRDGNHEVDFVIKQGEQVLGIEVKSGTIENLKGLSVFREKFPGAETIVVGTPQSPLEDFLAGNVPLLINEINRSCVR
ncbi:MAG: ATP-binding protein [Coriobacteriia bacterium]|nr:ATP-binding protein [Coriobacteriia bacterium]